MYCEKRDKEANLKHIYVIYKHCWIYWQAFDYGVQVFLDTTSAYHQQFGIFLMSCQPSKKNTNHKKKQNAKLLESHLVKFLESLRPWELFDIDG